MSSSNKNDTSRLSCAVSRVSTGRIIFVVCLICVAVVLGLASNALLAAHEKKMAQEQFDAIADRALDVALQTALRKRLGVVTLASMAGQSFPEAEMWPNINFLGFEAVVGNLIETSTGRTMGLMPLVYPHNLASFEDHAYNKVIAGRNDYPNTTGASSFGKGVFGLDFSLDNEDKRYHESDGNTTWGSPYKVFTPFLFHSSGPSILMTNLHSTALFGSIIDQVISCSNERQENEDEVNCGTLSDALILTGKTQDVKSGPGAIVIEPVYPAHSNTTLVGIISSTIVWEETLTNVFSSEISGIDCVLETESQVFTYETVHGEVFLRGEDDLHNPSFAEYSQTIILNPTGLFSNYSASYRLTLYPNEEFFLVYSTSNPILAMAGAFIIMLFTSMMFLLFDFFVRQELLHKKLMMQAKRNYVRYVSHEVRTPLNIVSMGLQLLLEELKKSCRHLQESNMKRTSANGIQKLQDDLEEWSVMSQDILSNAHSAVGVLTSLLQYDKIESQSLSLELEVIDILERVKETAHEFQLQAQFKNINLHFQVENGLVDPASMKAVGDEARLCQVLRNLISNALKFTRETGDITVRAVFLSSDQDGKMTTLKIQDGTLLAVPRNGTLEIHVKDSGVGLDEDEVRRVFNDGVQFHANALQQGQGSGIGLFISKGIMELHGGSLCVASEGRGKGTTFTMSLPLYSVPSTIMDHHPDDMHLTTRLAAADTDSIEPMRILVVDDSAMNRKLLVRLLQNRGHTCVQAENGELAVEEVRKAMTTKLPFHCILCDHEMPVKSGPEAAKEIRSLGCDSFIVGITGNLFREDIDLFKSCGADKVLPKPIKMDELEDTWHQCGVRGGHRAYCVGEKELPSEIPTSLQHDPGLGSLQRTQVVPAAC